VIFYPLARVVLKSGLVALLWLASLEI
jgi:hypothetical protein